mmetsp:Transcript_5888/g.12064  ORF Transcript_5888/g.12064 Transcript_5888/m.12064 type:complete len:556 (-) Transcript_5888:74-1741(-)
MKDSDPSSSDMEDGRGGGDGIMRGGDGQLSHFETTSGESFSDTQFADDASGTRVIRGGPGVSEATAFTKLRRWRKVIVGTVALLVIVVVVAFTMGRRSVLESEAYINDEGGVSSTNHGKDQLWWKIAGEPISQPNVLPGVEQDAFVEFGGKVMIDMSGDRMAISKQGVNRAGGGIDIYSHWDASGDADAYVPTQWFHEASLKFPPPEDGQHAHDDQAMDFSEDGRRVVFNQGNHIYVYFLDSMKGFNWAQLGNTIELPSDRDPTTTRTIYGSEIAMSGDGFFIAVLGYSAEASEAAWVDIFHFKSTLHGSTFTDEWVFVNTITLKTTKGATMNFDTLGRRLVVGEAPDDQHPACITVYDRTSEQDPSQWTTGSDPMKNINTSLPYDTFGSVVYLSNDGNRLALGTVNGEGNYFMVLQAKETSNEFGSKADWTILGKAHQKTPSSRRFGASVQLAFDGDQLVVGAPGSPDLDISGNPSNEQYLHGEVYLYRYNEKKDIWDEVVAPIRSVDARDAFGRSVSITEHDQLGVVVVAGAPLRYPTAPRGTGAVVAYSIKD